MAEYIYIVRLDEVVHVGLCVPSATPKEQHKGYKSIVQINTRGILNTNTLWFLFSAEPIGHWLPPAITSQNGQAQIAINAFIQKDSYLQCKSKFRQGNAVDASEFHSFHALYYFVPKAIVQSEDLSHSPSWTGQLFICYQYFNLIGFLHLLNLPQSFSYCSSRTIISTLT